MYPIVAATNANPKSSGRFTNTSHSNTRATPAAIIASIRTLVRPSITEPHPCYFSSTKLPWPATGQRGNPSASHLRVTLTW